MSSDTKCINANKVLKVPRLFHHFLFLPQR